MSDDEKPGPTMGMGFTFDTMKAPPTSGSEEELSNELGQILIALIAGAEGDLGEVLQHSKERYDAKTYTRVASTMVERQDRITQRQRPAGLDGAGSRLYDKRIDLFFAALQKTLASA